MKKLLCKFFMLWQLVPLYIHEQANRQEFRRLQKRMLELQPPRITTQDDLLELLEIPAHLKTLDDRRYYLRGVKEEILSLFGESDEIKLAKPPGQKLLKIVELVVSKKMYQSTFEPLVADWQEEYFEALDQKRGRVKLFFIHVRHKWAFAKACGLIVLLKFAIDTFFKIMSGK